nr:trypsin-like peptidase domain-containing protein [Desulfobulbaceae bacterium]
MKIYTVFNSPNYQTPWQMQGKKNFHGSGCIIEGNRILTNAHVIRDHIFVEVRRSGQAKKYQARVEAVSHASDLALLRVDDPLFFKNSYPLTLGELPLLQDKIAVYGFPDGGDRLSVTEGIVSRVEHVSYAHSNAYLLACQIDASINTGNSGGPVIRDGKLVGIAFQGLTAQNFDNIGYMVPTPIITHFLTDLRDGRYDGIPSLGLSLQKAENDAMRHFYQMDHEQTGVLINKIYPGSPAEGLLFIDDLLTGINGQDIANDGTLEFRQGERTFFGIVIHEKQRGETIELQVLRGGKNLNIKLQLSGTIEIDRLVPHMLYDKKPRYFIFGGFVFQPLTLNYLKEFSTPADWYLYAPTELLHLYQNGEPSPDFREATILSEVLADQSNTGYHEFSDNVIIKANGRPIRQFTDLLEALQS